ncbi:MAG: hypothetical protein J6P79_12915 [Pseudobutyrivibrio sp.]|nr:hypothetical protein [Pseudobutyrivibrio sp.]
MEYYLKLTFLISQMIKDEKKKKRAIKLARTIAKNDEAILDFIKKEGLITTGETKDDGPCTEPENADRIDELIYQYFRYKENEWNNRFLIERN